MFRTVVEISPITAMIRWLESVFSIDQPMLSKAGISASGSVTHTAVTVRTLARGGARQFWQRYACRRTASARGR